MPSLDRRMVRVTTGIAAAVALTVAISLPVACLVFERRYESGRLESELEMQAELIGPIAARNPQMWQYEALRIEAILDRRAREQHPVTREVLNAKGELLTRVVGAEKVRGHRIVRQVPIYESGRLAGYVRGEMGAEHMLSAAAQVGAGALLLALLAFYGLRTLPLRALGEAVERASYLANHDALTGLPNRSLFLDRLGRTLASLDRTNETAAVLFLDLDHFKDVNDTLGHSAGDLLLTQVVERVGTCLRKADTLARFGGDEFAVIEPHLKHGELASVLAQRIIETLRQPFNLDGHDVVIGCSVGISIVDPTDPAGADATELLRKADLALYRAKAEGRGTYRYFDLEMNRRLLERKALERDLRLALINDEFRLVYQPQLDLASGRVVGVETLLRWAHPQRGNVDPAGFISVCEEMGLIIPIGEWVLRQACRETRDWGDLKVAVNISPAQFRQPGLVEMIGRVLAETDYPPDRLELEITETVLLDDTEAVMASLRAIKALGVSIAMDDFGTGYSSLAYLRQFPFDKVKIDRAFIRDLGWSADAAAIIRAVVALSRSLGMRANAEGVETDEQAQRLLDEGCQEVQGFLFGRPVPALELAPVLQLDRIVGAPSPRPVAALPSTALPPAVRTA